MVHDAARSATGRDVMAHSRYVAEFNTMKPVSTDVEYFPRSHWTVLVCPPRRSEAS